MMEQISAGDVFTRLTVVSRAHSDKHGYIHWNCICECGAEKTVCSHELRSGKTKSCGCIRFTPRTHGHTQTSNGKRITPEYQAWIDMRRRCSNRKHVSYDIYGGRGISVCEKWSSFEMFYEDMGPRPDGMSLDRIDVNGNYEPNNCRWATQTQQSRNRRNNRFVEYNGISMCLSEWAEALGFTYHILKDRLSRGWSIDRAFNTPLRG